MPSCVRLYLQKYLVPSRGSWPNLTDVASNLGLEKYVSIKSESLKHKQRTLEGCTKVEQQRAPRYLPDRHAISPRSIIQVDGRYSINVVRLLCIIVSCTLCMVSLRRLVSVAFVKWT